MIKILTTGGSLDKTYSTLASDFIVGEPQIIDILREANLNLDYEVTSLFRKDSLAITDEDRMLIYETVLKTSHRQIVITHGTDTMTRTAEVLQSIPNKVIVLTGAMQPASFKITDAVFNIGCAIAAVQILADGIYIAMSGRIFLANQAQKNMTTNQFEEKTKTL